MKVDLPLEMYEQRTEPRNSAPLLFVLALLVAGLMGWQVFNLPGAWLKRNTAPPDFSGMNFGIRQVWIEADGTWTISREGYLDRMRTYIVSSHGVLSRETEMIHAIDGNDVSGVSHGSAKLMAGGTSLDVEPSPRYWEMLKRLRPPEATGSQQEEQRTEDPQSEPDQTESRQELPSYLDTGEAPMESVTEETPAEPSVVLRIIATRNTDGTFTSEVKRDRHSILTGHEYFPSRDSFAYLDPDLWLTTNAQRFLHHLTVTDSDGHLVIAEGATVDLNILDKTNRDCIVGRDPISSRLFIVLANGERFWYDAQTLQRLDQDILPGEWRMEYAALAFNSMEYSPDLGWPLSKAAHDRLAALQMVLFLLSLLVLATAGRKAWKFTSAATTADSSSSSKSAPM
ncbi:hypothetical protein JW859_15025 [bacterium]|nr:hypothetical protein [bacterium]